MNVSVEKCGVMKIGSFASQIDFEINCSKLKYVNLVNDLGVEFDTNLNALFYYSKKASTRANILLRAFHTTDLHVLIKAFKIFQML